MAVEFARTLKHLVDCAVRESRAELRFALGMVADVIVEAFDAGPDAAAAERGSAWAALELARAAAGVADAAQLIEHRLFGEHGDRRFRELELPADRTRGALSRFLDHAVWRAVENNLFVHVVWLRSPACALHLGTGRCESVAAPGLDLDAPGLLAALQQGSLLALVVPSPATARAAGDVEAAIATVLAARNALLALDARRDCVPAALASAQLGELGELLGELASKFSTHAVLTRR